MIFLLHWFLDRFLTVIFETSFSFAKFANFTAKAKFTKGPLLIIIGNSFWFFLPPFAYKLTNACYSYFTYILYANTKLSPIEIIGTSHNSVVLTEGKKWTLLQRVKMGKKLHFNQHFGVCVFIWTFVALSSFAIIEEITSVDEPFL